MKTADTLIIHPRDSSTQFLEPIYEKISSKEVVTGDVTEANLQLLMNESNRIMMMGHGMPTGLLHVGRFPSITPFVIDKRHVPLLKKKNNHVFIWCHADRFVETHDLTGFYTGMFISEVDEAAYCGLGRVEQKTIDESNQSFSSLVSDVAMEPGKVMFDHVYNGYGKLVATNPVAKYNHQRLNWR